MPMPFVTVVHKVPFVESAYWICWPLKVSEAVRVTYPENPENQSSMASDCAVWGELYEAPYLLILAESPYIIQ